MRLTYRQASDFYCSKCIETAVGCQYRKTDRQKVRTQERLDVWGFVRDAIFEISRNRNLVDACAAGKLDSELSTIRNNRMVLA